MAFRKKVRHLENQLNADQDPNGPVAGHRDHGVVVRHDLRLDRCQAHHDRAHPFDVMGRTRLQDRATNLRNPVPETGLYRSIHAFTKLG